MKKTTLRQVAFKLAFVAFVLLAPLGLRAQQSLPYSYGFEDNNLSADGWVAQVSSNSGINSSAAQTGSYGFRFYYSEQSGYLMSPIFTGNTSAVTVTFSYKEYSSSYGDEQFQVGYTTDETVTDPSAFTYGAVVTASTSWQDYEETFPAGTKRIAIKYIYNDAFYLYLDDFTFEVASNCSKPGEIVLGTPGATQCPISWTAGGSETSWNVYLTQGGSLVTGYNPLVVNTTPSCTLTGLTAGTVYNVAVEAICGSDVSAQRTSSFNTGLCEAANQCEITLVLNDSYGDGWNGNMLQVVDVTTSLVLGEYTVSSGASASYTLNVCSDRDINFVYVASGNYQYENGWSITDVNDDVITEHTGGNSSDPATAGVITTYTPSCTPITCPKPTGLTLGTITESEAPLTWTAGGSETSWKVYLNDLTTPVATVNTDSYTFTGLSANTSYTFGVAAVCGVGDESIIATVSGNTACGAYTIPYTYGFETADDMACWNEVDCEQDGYNNLSGYLYDATSNPYARTEVGGCFGFSSYNGNTDPQYFISPELTGITNGLHMEFYYRSLQNNDDETFEVGYSTTDKATASFTWSSEITSSGPDYKRFSANYPAGVKYVAIKYTAADSYYLFIDDITFEEAASCLEPTAVEANNITTTSAEISWTAGASETAWDIYVTNDNTDVPDGTTTPTVAGTTDNPHTLTALTPATTYYVYVRAACSTTDQSAWSAPVTFHTECEGMDLPYGPYGFENGALTVCWNHFSDNLAYNSASVYNANAHTGDKSLRFYRGSTAGDLVLALPVVDDSYDLSDYQFEFYAYATETSMMLTIGIMDDPNDLTTFVAQGSEFNPASSYTEYKVRFNGYTGSGKYVAIKVTRQSGSSGSIYMDDIAINPIPSCIEPTALSVSDESAHGATFGWTSNGTETAWQLYISENSTAPADDETNVIDADANPFTVASGLDPETEYHVWVRANCGTDGYSTWVGPETFTTTCDSYDIPYTYDFETEAPFNCWTPIAGVTRANSSSNAHAGSYYLRFAGTTSNLVALPQFNEPTNNLRVEFWTRPESTGGSSGKFAIGYMTDITDASTFVAVATYNSTEMTTTYVKKTVDFVGAPANATIAMRQFDCSTNYYWYVDDVTVKEIPSCVAPTGLAANATTTSAELSWNANSGETAWTLYWKKTTDENYTEVANATNPYTLNSLTPATNYQFYVVANCAADDASEPSAVFPFTTACDVISALGYSENFDTYTAGNNVLPSCWSHINTTTNSTYAANPRVYNSNTNSAPNCIYLYSYYSSWSDYDPQPQYAILPEMSGLAGMRVTMQARGYNTSSTFKVGTMSDPADASTFTAIAEQTGLTTSYQEFSFDVTNSNDHYLAIMIDAANSNRSNNGVYIDDITIAPIPSCEKPTSPSVTANGYEATFTWVSDVDNYEVVYATSATANPDDLTSATTTDEEFVETMTALGDYYFWVRANCGANGYSSWAGPASVHIGYCTPNPTSRDDKGITGVTFGSGDGTTVNNSDETNGLPSAAPFYGDYSSMIGAVQAGVESTVNITFGHTFTYGTIIWVDFDNSLSFEDNEIVYQGTSAGSSVAPHTLEATFTIPPTQATGDYRMRIATADSYFDSYLGGTSTANHSPCFQSSWSTCHDYTLRVLEAPSCMPASNVTVDPANITANSAVITWTNNNGASATYTVKQGTTVLTTNAVDSYTLGGLTAITTYPAGTYTIVSNCDETAVANVPAFTTDCEAITTFPWSENFEGFTASTVPTCWDNSASTSPTLSNYPERIWGVYEYSSNKMIRMYNYYVQGGTALINSPSIELPSSGVYDLTFDYAHNASCGNFTVKVSTDNGANFTDLASYSKGSGSSYTNPGDFTPATISLADYAGESIILQFFANANYDQGAIFVDNIKIEEYHVDKPIEANKWYAISSPVHNSGDNETLAGVTNLTSGTYDLYGYNEATGSWTKPSTILEQGKGYIYRRSSNTTLNFVGIPNNSVPNYTLSYACDDDYLKGFNLVGNPYPYEANPDMDCYKLTPAGTWKAKASDENVDVCEAVLVYTDGSNTTVSFSAPTPSENSSDHAALAFTVSNEEFEDVAYARFDNGESLPKIGHLTAEAPMLSIPVDSRRYAIANLGNDCESFNLAFRGTNGSYTLTLKDNMAQMGYVHLIDRATGRDIDMLRQSYTFSATGNDTDRFTVKLSPNAAETDNSSFVYWNGSAWVVEGNGTLQVFDVLGRKVFSKEVNTEVTIPTSQFPGTGVYIIRLGEKSQKIVVK